MPTPVFPPARSDTKHLWDTPLASSGQAPKPPASFDRPFAALMARFARLTRMSGLAPLKFLEPMAAARLAGLTLEPFGLNESPRSV